MPTFIKAGFWEQTCRTCKGYNGWLNLDQFAGGTGTSGTSGLTGTAGTAGASGTSGSAGTAGISGSSGSSGIAGTSGLSGDRYRTESVTEFTLGAGGTITVGTGLAYTTAQDIIISYDSTHHQVSMVVSYDSGTGVLVFGAPSETTGTGTYSDWTVNLNGAAGGNGSSGTSGSAGTAGTSGSSGVAGTSGSAGTSGAAGSSGVSGTAGVSGTSGTSYAPPLPVVYGLFAQTGNSTIITNTTVESSLINGGVGTLSIPANGFSVGDSFRGIFGGVINAENNQTIRVRVKAGSIVLLDSGAQNLGSAVIDDVWSLNIDFTIRQTGVAGVASIVSLGAFHYTKTNNASVQGFGFNVVNNTTFDTTVSNTLDVTVQWGAASTGNNIYSDIFVLNKVY